jgi:hypothetical protein
VPATSPDPGQPERPSAPRPRNPISLIIGGILGLAITICSIVLVAGVVGRSGEILAFAAILLPFFILAIFVVPAIVLLTALVRGNYGMVIGVLLTVPILYWWESDIYTHERAAMALDMSEIAAKEVWDGAAIRAAIDAHPTIALVGGDNGCHRNCIRILAETNLHLILVGYVEKQTGQLLSKASGDACLAAENRYLYLRFLEAGYADRCALEQEVTTLNGSVVVSNRSNFYPAVRQLIPGTRFQGDVREVFLIENGEWRLLGRKIEGRLEPTLSPADTVIGFLFGMHPPSAQIGSLWPSSEAFLSRIVGMTLDENTKPGHDDPEKIAAQAARLETDPKHGDFAAQIRKEALGLPPYLK